MSPLSLLTFFAAAAAAKKVSAAPHRGEANRPTKKARRGQRRRQTAETRRRRQTNLTQPKDPGNPKKSNPPKNPTPKAPPASPPKPAMRSIKSQYMNPTLTYWRFQKNRPTIRNTKPARHRSKARETREPSRQRGKKGHTPPHEHSAAGADHNDRRQPAMPITVRQEARTCRVLSRFSGRQAGPAR